MTASTSAADILKAHHARRHLRRIEIAEITDETGAPMVIHGAALTARTLDLIEKSGSGSLAKRAIAAVIHLARDEAGGYLFPPGADSQKMLENDVLPQHVGLIAARLLEISEAQDLGN